MIEQKEELENIIQDLEEENAYLINEYTRLQNELNTTNQSIQSNNQKASHFSLRSAKSSTLQGRANSNRLQQHLADTSAKYSHSSQAIPITPSASANSAQINSKYASLLASLDMGNAKESQILAEARSLRQHEDRLEARMKILENHNRLLETQLKQLRGLQSNVI
jgi:predicted nuclease with TOPRIM domain